MKEYILGIISASFSICEGIALYEHSINIAAYGIGGLTVMLILIFIILDV